MSKPNTPKQEGIWEELTLRAPVIRQEVARIVRSPLFKSSRRSQEFLNHIAERALAGSPNELKERLIGAALFGRATDYDTGSDSIVRVVANETRRRLVQFYSDDKVPSGVRVELPPGTYVPSFQFSLAAEAPGPVSVPPAIPVEPAKTRDDPRRKPIVRWLITVAGILLILCCVLTFQNANLRRQAEHTDRPALRVLPWSSLFEPGRKTRLILADTSVGGIQNLLQRKLSLEDYLNKKYIPDVPLPSEEKRFLEFLIGSQYTSASYASVAIRITNFAQQNSAAVNVSYARDISMRTVESGDNLIILGTARANPWVQLFEDRLNFRFQFSNGGHEPRFLNQSPRPGEQKEYIPGVGLPSFGESYGHIAFLPSSYGSGSVLLIAGSSSLATESAGELVTNLPRLQGELGKIGLRSGSQPHGFELLTEVTHIAGTPTRSKVVALRLSRE